MLRWLHEHGGASVIQDSGMCKLFNFPNSQKDSYGELKQEDWVDNQCIQ